MELVVEPLSSASSHSSLSMASRRKNTRDLPDLYECHCCGSRFPEKGRKEKLHTLDSEWRIVLLCKNCLHILKSAKVCSYCFSIFSERDEGFLDCRGCSCRVHLRCVPEQRGYLAASELDPELFTCVDCCAFPRSRIRNCSKYRDSCSARVSTVFFEGLVRDLECAAAKKVEMSARANKKAMVKALEAKSAAELARKALGLIVMSKKESKKIVETAPDEELAFQLHQSMNCAQRNLRNSCSVNSDQLVDANGEQCNINLCGRESEGSCQRIFGEVQF